MIDTILLASDGSASAADAASPADESASCSGAKVVVLSVAQPIAYGDFVPALPGLADDTEMLAQAEAYRQADMLCRAGIDASAVVRVSPSVDGAIVETAERMRADPIVMDTHGRSGLARAVLGSVADRVLRSSTVPVLLVRHEDAR